MSEPYEGYAIVELMGHRRMAGRASQAEQYGVAMLRLDVPRKDGSESTHFYSGSSIYAVHPVAEDVARQVAAQCDPAPVQRWKLPALPERTGSPTEYDDDPCADCSMLEDDCVCGEDNDYDDQPETGPPSGEPPDFEAEACVDNDHDDEPCEDPETGPPARELLERDCDCRPGYICDEHMPF